MLQSIRLLFFVCLTCASGALTAQDEEGLIFLLNASFEDMPRNSSPPRGWTNCGAPGETPPDVHPDPEFLFKVGMEAQHGNTFLGMVTRDTETWESVGQQLAQPFVAGQCYRLDIELARSLTYLSMSRMTRQPTNYVTPVRLRVWGGYSVCDRAQLLGASGLVSNSDWRKNTIKLSPEDDFTHIILEAYYPEAILFATNGNILVDNARPLVPIDCDDEAAMLAEFPVADSPVPPSNPDADIVTTPVPPRTKTPTTQPNSFVPKTPEEPTVRLGQTEAVLRQGSVFAVENISFKANSDELEEESEAALQEIVGFLKQNSKVIVEIGGHASRMASDNFASDLSSNRAKTVVSYLKRYNIGFERLLPKGYGKSKPVCMDDTQDCNRRNQRVEVKILKIRSTK
ncbi:OmpA family protein [Neolewinella aurantiaca]|uniref:OmpA family protein n=1 Tax=Neolewinella aurantiaca TaxID=2602767 RepID=A0A5C7FVJ8_9BACT|nr:OmpA family protein [Neolewinella aurantiaca]TXF88840.1 OmpA family protein [Neolewinella aurantiaca]